MNCINIKIKNVILDMDGVLWRGDTPMPGLDKFIPKLRELGIGYVLATNNATKTAEMYVERLARFGVDIPAGLILNSAEATARYLRHHFPNGESAYVVGEEGLQQAMRSQGFSLVDDQGLRGAGKLADFVVVGFTRHVCYPHLASAAYYINNGAQFIGTNPDVSIPTEYGPLPGAGSLLAYLQAATGKAPIVIGKPSAPMFEEALRILGNEPMSTAMVGDRLATDIAGGNSAGLITILVLSGITKLEEVSQSPFKPDCVVKDINELSEFLMQNNSE